MGVRIEVVGGVWFMIVLLVSCRSKRLWVFRVVKEYFIEEEIIELV